MDTSAKESVVFPMLNDTKMKICRGMSHIHCTCPNMLASFECCSIGTGVAQVLCPKTLCLTPNICFTRRTQCYTLCTYNRGLVQVVCPKHSLSQSIRECYVFVGNVLIDSRWIHITPFSRSISMEWLSQLSRFSCRKIICTFWMTFHLEGDILPPFHITCFGFSKCLKFKLLSSTCKGYSYCILKSTIANAIGFQLMISIRASNYDLLGICYM